MNSTLEQSLEQILVDGPLPILMKIMLSVKVLTALLGCVSNITLIYIAYKQKNLHGICNILIVFNAFCNMLYQTGYSVWPVLLVSEIRLMKLSICFYFQFFPAIGSSANIATLLIIALDRLLCIAYPQRYPIVNKHTYFSIIAVFITAFPFYNVFLSYQFVLINSDKNTVSCLNFRFNHKKKDLLKPRMSSDILLDTLKFLSYEELLNVCLISKRHCTIGRSFYSKWPKVRVSRATIKRLRVDEYPAEKLEVIVNDRLLNPFQKLSIHSKEKAYLSFFDKFIGQQLIQFNPEYVQLSLVTNRNFNDIKSIFDAKPGNYCCTNYSIKCLRRLSKTNLPGILYFFRMLSHPFVYYDNIKMPAFNINLCITAMTCTFAPDIQPKVHCEYFALESVASYDYCLDWIKSYIKSESILLRIDPFMFLGDTPSRQYELLADFLLSGAQSASQMVHISVINAQNFILALIKRFESIDSVEFAVPKFHLNNFYMSDDIRDSLFNQILTDKRVEKLELNGSMFSYAWKKDEKNSVAILRIDFVTNEIVKISVYNE